MISFLMGPIVVDQSRRSQQRSDDDDVDEKKKKPGWPPRLKCRPERGERDVGQPGRKDGVQKSKKDDFSTCFQFSNHFLRFDSLKWRLLKMPVGRFLFFYGCLCGASRAVGTSDHFHRDHRPTRGSPFFYFLTTPNKKTFLAQLRKTIDFRLSI